ncbi:hypothetical protein ScPMuIL_000845 [Solemya velum]
MRDRYGWKKIHQHLLSMDSEKDVRLEQGGSSSSSNAEIAENSDHDGHNSENEDSELDNISNSSIKSIGDGSELVESKCNDDERGECSGEECSENVSDHEISKEGNESENEDNTRNELEEPEVGKDDDVSSVDENRDDLSDKDSEDEEQQSLEDHAVKEENSSAEENQDDVSDKDSEDGDQHSLEDAIKEGNSSVEENPLAGSDRNSVDEENQNCEEGGENVEDLGDRKLLEQQNLENDVNEDGSVEENSHSLSDGDQQNLEEDDGSVENDSLDLNDSKSVDEERQNSIEPEVSDEDMETEMPEGENKKIINKGLNSDRFETGDQSDNEDNISNEKQKGSFVQVGDHFSGNGMEDVSDEEDGDSDEEDGKEKFEDDNLDSGREDISEEEEEEMFGETSNSDFNKLDLSAEAKTVNEETKQNGNTSENQNDGVEKIKSRTSFTEDHVELDYEDVIEESKAHDDSKEKLDDSREEGECPDGELSDKDDGEVEDDEDCEEGEIKEPGGRRIYTKPTCRFYIKGHCTWGMNCRFLHPGINDKGNYRLIERPGFNNEGLGPWGPFGRGGPMGMDNHFEPEPPPRPPVVPPVETAWERGVRNAKELRKKATERKEQESNFEDKKLNLSLPLEDEKDHNKENDRLRTIVKDPYYDQQYDEEIYDKSAVPDRSPGIHHGQFENFEIRWNREPEFLPYRDRLPEREKYSRERVYVSPSPPPTHVRYDRHRERREKNRDPSIPRRPKADEWHDPWRRSKSPKGKRHSSRSRSRGRRRRRSRRSYSYSSSYSSSSYSGSSRSRSRSSSYSSYSSRSSYSRSSSYSSRSSVSPHRSPKRVRKEPLPPGIGSQKVILPPRVDQPRSAVAVKGKNRSPEKYPRNAAAGGAHRPIQSQQKPPPKPFQMTLPPAQHPALAPDRGKKKPPPSRPPEMVKNTGPSSRAVEGSKEPASGRPLEAVKGGSTGTRVPERPRSLSSSGSSLSRSRSRSREHGRKRSRSSSSSASRSSSASSLSSVSSKSSTSSSGSADSDHLYRGVGASPVRQGTAASPQKKKVKEKKSLKAPTKENDRGGAAAGRSEPRAGRMESRSVPRPEGIGRPVTTTPTKSKDPLKLTGQKSNIKLILSKTGKPPPQNVRKRAGDSLSAGPPAKRMPPNTPTKTDKPVKKPELSARPPSPRAKPQVPAVKQVGKPVPISPTKPPNKPPTMAPPAAAQKAKKSASNRREELLKQLKAVEDAIARKRSKMQ